MKQVNAASSGLFVFIGSLLFYVTHLNQIFGYLNGIESSALSDLVACQPQGVTIIIG